MKHIPATPLTTHRCARLIAWGRLMLVWLSAVMFADRRASRRHMRTRYHLFDPHCFARYVGNLILMRALADKPHLRAQGLLQQNPLPGLHTKARPQRALRAARGSHLRKLLRHRDLRTRFGIFMYALDHLDELARVLSPRLARRLTRLQPILMRPCVAEALRTLAANTPHAAEFQLIAPTRRRPRQPPRRALLHAGAGACPASIALNRKQANDPPR